MWPLALRVVRHKPWQLLDRPGQIYSLRCEYRSVRVEVLCPANS